MGAAVHYLSGCVQLLKSKSKSKSMGGAAVKYFVWVRAAIKE